MAGKDREIHIDDYTTFYLKAIAALCVHCHAGS
jgi:hypothetical protein